jgi:hypothetical protein
MQRSTNYLTDVLETLSQEAQRLGLTATEWASRAGLRKETLSRLRNRDTCDFSTLRALAQVVGARVGVFEANRPGSTADGHFPSSVSRDYEEQLLQLCASKNADPRRWENAGPRFFMAGLAVMLASLPSRDRRSLLGLAEHLHPGASEPSVFARWLERSPVRPTRFLPLLEAESQHAA